MVYQNVSNRYLKWLLIVGLFLLIFLIGFSRVYLRVHYASDVIAGFAAGFIWVVLSLFMVNRMEKFSQRKIDPVIEMENPEPRIK